MSYVTAIKDLLGDDLKQLIHHITGYQESSSEFQNIEEKCWSIILNHNCVSVTDETVKSTLSQFVDKFIFHGFHIKAQNLKLLIDAYTNLAYFKDHNDRGLQWSLIDLLIKLSYKPTHDINDDEPLDIVKVKSIPAPEEDEIDWKTYLKEGLEKFVLPESDEESWSSLSDDLATNEEIDITRTPEPIAPPVSSVIQYTKEKVLEQLRKEEEIKLFVEENTQKPWWIDPDFREKPTSSSIHLNWCFQWEEIMKKKGIEIEDTRILSEYKVVRELLCLFHCPLDHAGSFIEKTNKGYAACKRASIPSLSPPMFAAVMESHVCDYLIYIKELNKFIDKILKGGESIPFTYYTYAISLKEILHIFNLQLEQIDNTVKRQESIYTITMLVNEIKPWLRHIEYIYSVHIRAIFDNYEVVENWKCALRLLSVLYNELSRNFNNWQKRTILELFLKSFRPYLRILDKMLKDISPYDFRNEFVIFRSADEVVGVEIRDYLPIIRLYGGDSIHFWQSFFEVSLRALSSVHFLLQLDKKSNIIDRPNIYDLFFSGFMDNLKSLLLKTNANFKTSVPESISIPEWLTPLKGKELFSFRIPRHEFSTIPLIRHRAYYLVEKCFDVYREPPQSLPKDTLLDCFIRDLAQYNLEFIMLAEYIKKQLLYVLEQHFQPIISICNIVLEEYQLINHLQYICDIIFVRIDPMVPAILNELLTSTNSEKLTYSLRESLVNYMPVEVIPEFSLLLSPLPSMIVGPNHTLEMIEYLSVKYKVKKQLRLIITEEMLSLYSQIFRFYLQLKCSYKTLLKLRFKKFVSNNSSSRAYRLFSLKMWLLHTISAFNKYFSSFNEKIFQEEIKKLCQETTDLYNIQMAHHKFIKKCKSHCFLNNSKIKKLIYYLFRSTETLLELWYLEEKSCLPVKKIDQLEKDVKDTIQALAVQLELKYLKHKSIKNPIFEMLHDEVIYDISERII
ncbi:hypothetical protein O3M35_009102 [Rhynocoris fuscipes]|uniref:Gamma-tubulin complex component n=1 Tax=Rhynocoris fuscipes TaxID=488301 RepID=A0AAW1D3Y7_9HEMI